MNTFILPDLGEGLQEAELVEWLVEEGAQVKEDQLVLLVETAKAVVEIPAPASCTVQKIKAKPGDTVRVGQALFDYEAATDTKTLQPEASTPRQDKDALHQSVSVVGELSKASDEKTNFYEAYTDKPSSPAEPVCINAFKEAKNKPAKTVSNTQTFVRHDLAEATNRSSAYLASPSTVAFAKKLGLEELLHHTYYGELNLRDLLKIYEEKQSALEEKARAASVSQNGTLDSSRNDNAQRVPLKGARKFMAQVMTSSHQQIPAVTLFDDVDISHWQGKEDITLRMIQAIVAACKAVPILNTWYDSKSMSLEYHESVHLGLAVNAETGLYVPVIRDSQNLTGKQLRSKINDMRKQIKDQSIAAKDLLGATISLSNFGVLTGRYATPIIVTPQVCIVGAGKVRTEPVVRNDKLQIGRVLPLSLSFDHRAATGGEAAEFMNVIIQSLSQ